MPEGLRIQLPQRTPEGRLRALMRQDRQIMDARSRKAQEKRERRQARNLRLLEAANARAR
jgi:hypothetical protein